MAQTKRPAKLQTAAHHRKADQYNDPAHNYREYWTGRDYEDAAERIALNRLLKGCHFKNAVDVGGGYGRLSVLLSKYADHVTLAEPSRQQLDIAKDYLKDFPTIDRELMQADNLRFKDGSVDLLTMVRVMHHLPDPAVEFDEISRVLSADGIAIIEVANYAHALNRVRHLMKGKKIPLKPVDIRSKINRKKNEIPFVNHNPKTVIRQLAHAGLEVEEVLSVSNLRNPRLKRVLPQNVMLAVETAMQKPLSGLYFGPSIFLLARKIS